MRDGDHLDYDNVVDTVQLIHIAQAGIVHEAGLKAYLFQLLLVRVMTVSSATSRSSSSRAFRLECRGTGVCSTRIDSARAASAQCIMRGAA